MQPKISNPPNLLYSLEDIQCIDFLQLDSTEASLFVYENMRHVPFSVQRIFTIKTCNPCVRGFHAHKKCTQLLVCLNGTCVVTIDDGIRRKNFTLGMPNSGLLMPPTIWSEQVYEANTILMVLTDRLYEKSDYIRNYDEFLKFRNIK